MRLACRSAGVRACGQCSAPSLLPCSAPNGGQQPRAVLQGQSQRLRARESAPTLQIASTSPAPLARTGPLWRLSRVDWLEPSGTTKRLSKRLAVEHQLRGSAFRSTDGKSRCFAARERLFRPGRDKFPLTLRPPAATPALGEWIALNERPRRRPARHPHRPSRAVARSPGLSKTSDRWWCPPRTRSEQCLESCNSRALRASGSRRPACGWTLEDRRNWPRVQRNGRWEMLWTLSVHNNSMGSVPIRSPNTIPFSGHRCRSTS